MAGHLAQERTDRSPRSAGAKWLQFAVVAMGLFAAVLDFGMVNVALPTIADDFGLPLPDASWIVLGPALAVSASLLPVGSLSDVAGRKRIYVLGVVLFGVGSLLAAISPNMPSLVVTRVLASFGAAMRMATGYAMVVVIFPPEERGRGLGANTSVVGLALIVAPILGGTLVDAWGWRSIFLLQAAGSVAVLVPALWLLDSKRVEEGRRRLVGRFDVLGVVLSAGALTMLILTMNSGNKAGWTSPWILAGAGAAVALTLAFVYWELRAGTPLLDLRLFGNGQFSWAMSARTLGFLAGSAWGFLMPFYLQNVQGYAPSRVGFVIFPSALGVAVTSAIAGRLSDRFGIRPFVVVGMALITVGGVMLSTFDVQTSVFLIMPVLLVLGIGSGLWGSPNASAAMSSVPPSSIGAVSALLNLARTVSQVTGVALASAIVAGVFASHGYAPDISAIKDDATGGMAGAFVSGARYTYLVLACVGLMALVAGSRSRPPLRRRMAVRGATASAEAASQPSGARPPAGGGGP